MKRHTGLLSHRLPQPMTLTRFAPFITLIALIPLPTAQAQSLAEVYQKALVRDARFAAARGAYTAGIEKYPQGRSQLLPTLTINGEKMYSDSELTYDAGSPFEGGTRNYEDLKYSATLTQPLYRKQNFAIYRQSRAQMAAAEAQFAFANQDLILRVSQAYFDLLSAQQYLAAAAANTASMKLQNDRARIQLELGAGSRLEASEARSKFEVARAQELAARHELVNKEQALRRIIRELPGTLDELRPDFLYMTPDPDDVAAWVKTAEQQNAQLQALHANVKAARQDVERAKAGHYPTVDLVAQYSMNDSSGSAYTSAASDTVIKSAGVRVEMPIYQGGVVNSRVREAEGNLDKARGEFEDAHRETVSQVTQHFNATINAIEQVHALEQALASSREASRATRIGLEVGTRNLVDLLNAEQQVFEVARELTRARQEYIMNRLRLMADAGQLTDNKLLELNAHLAPPSADAPTAPTTAAPSAAKPPAAVEEPTPAAPESDSR
jgi:outer membrane protein